MARFNKDTLPVALLSRCTSNLSSHLSRLVLSRQDDGLWYIVVHIDGIPHLLHRNEGKTVSVVAKRNVPPLFFSIDSMGVLHRDITIDVKSESDGVAYVSGHDAIALSKCHLFESGHLIKKDGKWFVMARNKETGQETCLGNFNRNIAYFDQKASAIESIHRYGVEIDTTYKSPLDENDEFDFMSHRQVCRLRDRGIVNELVVCFLGANQWAVYGNFFGKLIRIEPLRQAFKNPEIISDSVSKIQRRIRSLGFPLDKIKVVSKTSYLPDSLCESEATILYHLGGMTDFKVVKADSVFRKVVGRFSWSSQFINIKSRHMKDSEDDYKTTFRPAVKMLTRIGIPADEIVVEGTREINDHDAQRVYSNGGLKDASVCLDEDGTWYAMATLGSDRVIVRPKDCRIKEECAYKASRISTPINLLKRVGFNMKEVPIELKCGEDVTPVITEHEAKILSRDGLLDHYFIENIKVEKEDCGCFRLFVGRKKNNVLMEVYSSSMVARKRTYFIAQKDVFSLLGRLGFDVPEKKKAA